MRAVPSRSPRARVRNSHSLRLLLSLTPLEQTPRFQILDIRPPVELNLTPFRFQTELEHRLSVEFEEDIGFDYISESAYSKIEGWDEMGFEGAVGLGRGCCGEFEG